MTAIGRLERVTLREVWPHEAHDLTQWLQGNVDVINEILDVNLANVEREQAAGAFSVDLVAEDDHGNPVVIENQLTRSDHDHLGKLLTYLAAFDASTAIWIVSDPRPEHVSAVTWLNESSGADFYLLKLEAVRIGSSLPAPLFTKIVGPSEEISDVGDSKKEFTETHHMRERFWTELLGKAAERSPLHANITPGRYHWIGTSAGVSGINFNYVILQHDGRVELYIDRGDQAENKAVFDQLAVHREEIDTAFGEPLTWQRLEAKRASRISQAISIGGHRDADRWLEQQEAMIDAMERLHHALRPHLDRLEI